VRKTQSIDFESNLFFPSFEDYIRTKDEKLSRKLELPLKFKSVDEYKKIQIAAITEATLLQIRDIGFRYYERTETIPISLRDCSGNQEIETVFRSKGIHLYLGCVLRWVFSRSKEKTYLEIPNNFSHV
jgi:hypothetical protein